MTAENRTDVVSMKLLEKVSRDHFTNFTFWVRKRFLEQIEATGSARRAADMCDLSLDMLHLHRGMDDELARDWDDAIERGNPK